MLEQNLIALSRTNTELRDRLIAAKTNASFYTFLPSRSGQLIPAWRDKTKSAPPRALHSLVDPKREAERLLSVCKDEGFLVFLGLGGGFAIESALTRPDTERVLVIDYGISGIVELFGARDYTAILGDPRVLLLIDAPPPLIEQAILDEYNPALAGGIRVMPLRSRTEFDTACFNTALDAIQRAINLVSNDYSAQAFFGMRWFSNIVRNILSIDAQDAPFPAVKHVSIAAAGPSLDMQLPRLAETRNNTFLLATDTSLPALLLADLTPDAVVSIDCQHISYLHFMGGLPCPLYLDLASPPLVASCSPHPRFFSSGHPLTRYVSRTWRPLPAVDTSGGNVTYTALSLADSLGAEVIALYGADFAYPFGQTYARGTYINPSFECRQTRLAPYESLASAFLYRSGALKRVHRKNSWYYETPLLTMYRTRLKVKAETLHATVESVDGLGAPIEIRQSAQRPKPAPLFEPNHTARAYLSAPAFLASYCERIKALPCVSSGVYIKRMDAELQLVFATLLPLAAAIKRRNPQLHAAEIIEQSRIWSISEIERVCLSSTHQWS
ncbi:MAG: DUF115 domain-containing protein [Treponema sp.]|jgi:hypothetical protein|nr:DUF115 domain-containing protein [Treponema sp.]